MSRSLTVRVLAVYLATRVACLIGLARSGGPAGTGLSGAVRAFDGFWYKLIVEHGYPAVLEVDRHGQLKRSAIAFFPGFPLLVKPFVLAGAPFWAAALAVNTVVGAAAALLVAALARRRTGSDRAALLAAALWSVVPVSFVLTLSYSEALFCALAAGCLLALAADRWVVAGLLAALAGATRPTGVVLALACLVGAVVAVPRVAAGHPGAARLGRVIHPFAAPLLAPLGMLAYFGFLWNRYGRPDAWFAVEREGWHTRLDFGASAFQRLGRVLSGDAPALAWVYVAVVILLALALLLFAAWDRLPAAQLAYCLGVIALALVSHGVYSSVPRMLLPAFPLLIPPAARLARLPWPVGAALVIAGLVALPYATITLLANPAFAP